MMRDYNKCKNNVGKQEGKRKKMSINDLTIGEAREIASMFQSISGNTGNAVSGVTEQTSQSVCPFIGRHCVIRTDSDGVHVGIVISASGTEYLIGNDRRIWQWQGAFTLHEIATTGIESSSRVSVEVPESFLTQVISVVPTTQAARDAIAKCHS